MVNKKMQSKSLFKYFIFLFVLILVVMFLSNARNPKVCELASVEEGIERLYTIGNEMIAVSTDKKVYIWDWDEVCSDKPLKQEFAASQLISLASRRVLWVPSKG